MCIYYSTNQMTVWLAIIINLILFLILSIISGYWSCYFIKRIYSLRRYKRREVSCISGYYDKERRYDLETDIWKYTILLWIIACELISCLLYTAADSYRRFLSFHKITNATAELPYSECLSYNRHELDKVTLYTEIPYVYGIWTIAKSAIIFLVGFTIYLMNYLMTRIKNIKVENSGRFLILTALLCAVIIITGFIESLSILNTIFFMIFAIVYICIFIRTSKHYKHALLQRAMECLIQHRSNKRAMREYRNTKLYVNILCVGYLLILTSNIQYNISVILVSILFFGNCYFPSNLFPSLSYVLQTEEEIGIFLEVLNSIGWLGLAITYAGIFVIWFPMICITIYYWIKPIRERFSCNRKIKYRISESSLKHLLVHN